MGQSVSASETEMLFVICEQLYAEKMEMVKNSQEILELQKNNADIVRMRNKSVRDEREKLAKSGRVRLELLTDEEREDLRKNIRKIPFATLIFTACDEGHPEFGFSMEADYSEVIKANSAEEHLHIEYDVCLQDE